MLLARFEQIYRAGLPAVEFLLPLVVQFDRSLGALALSVATEPTLQDLDAVARATIEDLLYLRGAEALYIGPTFAQSAEVGGADADLIADGALPRRAGRGRR